MQMKQDMRTAWMRRRLDVAVEGEEMRKESDEGNKQKKIVENYMTQRECFFC